MSKTRVFIGDLAFDNHVRCGKRQQRALPLLRWIKDCFALQYNLDPESNRVRYDYNVSICFY